MAKGFGVLLLIALLSSSVGASSYAAASEITEGLTAPAIASGKDDYVPGEIVTLSGSNWQPGESVHIRVNDSEGATWSRDVDVVADDGGNVADEFTLPDWFVATYSVSATGAASGTATTTFTDSISFTDSATNDNGPGATTLTLSKPAGVAAGDVMLAQITFAGGSSVNVTAPSGWTQVGSDNNNGTSVGQRVYSKVATGSEPSSYTWILSSLKKAAGGISGYRGVDTSSPVDAVAFGAGSGTSLTAPSVDPTVRSTRVVRLFGTLANTTLSAPTGLTERYERANTNVAAPAGPTASADDADQFSDAATGPASSTAGSTAAWVAQTVALDWRQANTNDNGNAGGASLTLGKPSDSTPGDVLIAQVAFNGGSAVSVSTPSGWNLISKRTNAGGPLTQAAYWKRAGSSEPTSYQWTFSSSQEAIGGITAYSGVASSGDPVDVSTTNPSSDSSVGAGTTFTASSVTTTAANDIVIALYGTRSGSNVNVSTPSGMVERYDVNANGSTARRGVAADDMEQAAVGATGPKTATGSNSATSVTHTIALRRTVPNRAPVASDDSNSINEDSTLTVAAPGVLGNDTDADGDSLSATLASGPSHGTLTLEADGSFSYTPAANYFGGDSFTYTIGDGNGGSDTATVSITVSNVNDDPVANDDTATVDEDSSANAIAVLSNDNDGPDVGETLTITAIGTGANAPQHGSASIGTGANAGSILYTPAANYFGGDSFTYTIGDGNGGSDTATVSITVTSVNDPPSFTKGSNQTVNEDAGAQSVTGWATNISAGPANESGQSVSFVVSTDNGTLFSGQPSVGANGTLTYTPAANAYGSATVSVKAKDTGGGLDTSAEQTFTITVNPVNDAPSFTKGADQTVNEDAGPQTVAGWATNISRGPSNESAQTVSFAVTNNNNALFSAQPAVSSTGELTFTSDAHANGVATVYVKIKDNGGTANGGVDESGAQTFTITVNPVNDAPTLTNDKASQAVQYSDSIAAVTFTGADVDNSGSSLTRSVAYKVGAGSFTSGLPNGLTLAAGTPTANAQTWKLEGKMLVAPGTYVVRVTVSDGSLSKYSDITITVNPEDARSYYTGSSLFFASSTSASSVTATLAATVKDITAETGDSAYDAEPGNITNAKVTFEIRDFNNNIVASASCSDLEPSLVAASDEKVGTVSCQQALNVSSTQGGSIYNIRIKVNGYYVDTAAEATSITVALPLATSFITGGGYLVPTTSAGTYASDAGRKTNFGFNVKYNKSGTNLQGNINIIVRKGGKLYQFKSNALSSLGVKYCKVDGSGNLVGCDLAPTSPCTTNGSPTCPITATFQGKANLNDVTGATPVSLGGNLTLQMALTDRGEPGSADSLAITVYDGNVLRFSSEWNGTRTVEKILTGGNLVAH